MNSQGSPEFWQRYRQLPEEVRAAARRAYQRFWENPAHPGLSLERLRADPRLWSVRISRDYRAVAIRNCEEWIWIWIGSHRDFDREFSL